MIVDNLEFHVKRSGDTAARGTDRLSKSLKNLKGSSGSANKGLSGLMHTIGRLGKMMILRQIIRAVMKAMKEGLENAYKFNSMMGGEMSKALDSLKSAGVQATGALGSAFGEMIANVAPILIYLLNLIPLPKTILISHGFSRCKGTKNISYDILDKSDFNKVYWLLELFHTRPICLAFSISSCIRGSRSFSTRLSSTASFRNCFSTPTSLLGFRWNISIISLPSITGCNRRT